MTLDVRWAAEKWPLTGLLPRVANARPWDMKAGAGEHTGGSSARVCRTPRVSGQTRIFQDPWISDA